MKTSTILAIALPTVAVGGLGAYFVLRKKGAALPAMSTAGYYPPPPTAPIPAGGIYKPGNLQVAAAAATNGPSGSGNMFSNLVKLNSAGVSAIANKFVPGSGEIAGKISALGTQLQLAAAKKVTAKVGSAVKSVVGKLKFW